MTRRAVSSTVAAGQPPDDHRCPKLHNDGEQPSGHEPRITFAKADELRQAVRLVPLDRLLIETDCPYLAPVPHRGKRNEPAFVRHVAQRIAEVKGLPLEEVARATAENARAFFGFPGAA